MNYEHYKKLKECANSRDAEKWNEYKKEQEGNNERIDLRFANLDYFFLKGFDLSNANLRYASLGKAEMLGTNVTQTEVRYPLYVVLILCACLCFLPVFNFIAIYKYGSSYPEIRIVSVLLSSLILSLVYRRVIGIPLVLSIIGGTGVVVMSAIAIYSISVFDAVNANAIVLAIIIAQMIFFVGITPDALTHTGNNDTSGTFAGSIAFVFAAAGVFAVTLVIGFTGFDSNFTAIVGASVGTIISTWFYHKKLRSNNIALQWAIDPALALGYIPPEQASETFKEQERQLRQKEKELFEITKNQELDAIREDIEVLKNSINSQKKLYSKIESVLSQFEKPNTYIRNLVNFNWWMLGFFVVLTTLALTVIGYFEYGIYQKYWGAKPTSSSQSALSIAPKVNSTFKSDSATKRMSSVEVTSIASPAADVPFWAYSPIIFAGVILGFAVTQINRRLKEINSLNEKRRFVEGVKSTLQAYNLTHNAEETEAQIKKIVEKLEGYYFQLQKEEDKESEESGSNALVEQLLNAFKGNGNP